MCVIWSGTTSLQFTVINRVKQGGVLSPMLFAIYTVDLLKCLKDTGVGCHIGCPFKGESCSVLGLSHSFII